MKYLHNLLLMMLVCLTLIVLTPIDSRADWQKLNLTFNAFFNKLTVVQNYLFAMTQNMGLYYSSDIGNSWNSANTGLGNNIPMSDIVISQNKAYLATQGGGIFVSDFPTFSWKSFNSGLNNFNVYSLCLTTKGLIAGCENGYMYRYSTATNSWTDISKSNIKNSVWTIFNDGTKVYIGTDNGGVFVSTNEGDSWIDIANGNINLSVQSITTSGNNIYIGTAGGGVFFSSNMGTDWGVKNNQLGSGSVYSLFFAGDTLLASSDQNGVFFSTDSGNQWNDFNAGLDATDVLSLTRDNQFYYLCTTPPGTIWRSSTTLAVNDIPIGNNQLRIYPNPVRDRLNVTLPDNFNGYGIIQIFDMTGAQVFKSGRDMLTNQIDISRLNLPDGLYNINIICNGRSFNKSFLYEQ